MGPLMLDARAGLLGEQIDLLHNVRASNGAGGSVDSWQVVETVRGRHYAVRQRSGELQGIAGEPTSMESIEFVVELPTGGYVDSSWRCRTADGRVFAILEVQNQSPVAIIRGRYVEH